MKIRNRHLVKFAGRAGSGLVLGLARTLRFEALCLGEPNTPRCIAADNTDRLIYAVWHENLILPCSKMGDPSISVLISKHADGQILGSLIDAVGMGMVQGSTNRGGVEAVRKLLNPNTSRRHLSMTPDGPRGPRRLLQPGIVYIASRTGMKIVCAGIGYQNPWRMNSWDQFAIPNPCTRAKLITTPALTVPPGLKSHELETYRVWIQAEMDRVNLMAEVWAATNRLPSLPAVAAVPDRYRAAA